MVFQGYIDHALSATLTVCVLGLECDTVKCDTALKRMDCSQIDGMATSCRHETFHLRDTPDSIASLGRKIVEHFPSQRWGRVLFLPYGKSIKFGLCNAPALAFHRVMALSLHGCGDLSSTILKAFVKVEEIDTLLLIPCCYHHMTAQGFPLSSLLRKQRVQLSPYSLRLGTQESPRQWAARDRQRQSARVVFRAIAQLYLQQSMLYIKPLLLV